MDIVVVEVERILVDGRDYLADDQRTADALATLTPAMPDRRALASRPPPRGKETVNAEGTRHDRDNVWLPLHGTSHRPDVLQARAVLRGRKGLTGCRAHEPEVPGDRRFKSAPLENEYPTAQKTVAFVAAYRARLCAKRRSGSSTATRVCSHC
jgi:hypothetical protein